jgi:hypothetical protein
MINTQIPWDAAGITVFLLSMGANVLALWILLWIFLGKIQIQHQARFWMIMVNTVGIIWNCISVYRYYYEFPPPYFPLIHYLIGVCITTGDFMCQFEILKLFHVITGLPPIILQWWQWISLAFCFVAGALGTILMLLYPTDPWLLAWDTYGIVLITAYIGFFYLWMQIFLVTKLYQTMQKSAKKEIVKDRNTIAYVQFIAKLLLVALCQYLGAVLWGWGYIGTDQVVRDRMLIRIGENIGQFHLVLNVLYIKAIKEFKFPAKVPSTPREKPDPAPLKSTTLATVIL